ncbi:MAG: hypothetical protein H0W58_13410 [Acidobacteria bacterium]|nr:hypothetical protein [Acidobacteriota bacterium]
MKNQKFRNNFIRSIIFSSLLAVAFLVLNFALVQASDEGECDKECRRALASARAATAKYHNISEALADGFVQVSPCVAVPGLGAMGFHYANFARAGNPNLDPAEPETLLYIPDEDGDLWLVGLEYARFGPPTLPVPTLFGQEFHYDSRLGAYTLHVWAWRNNPSGMFAAFNPKLRCPAS